MKPRRLASDTSASMVTDMVGRIARLLVAGRRRLSNSRERMAHLREKARRPEVSSGEVGHDPLGERSDLALQLGRQRQAKRGVPPQLPHPPEDADRAP